jgi:hypothetical protein
MRQITVRLKNGKRALYKQSIRAYDEGLTTPNDGRIYVRYKHDHEIDPHYKPRQLVAQWGDVAIPEIAIKGIVRRGPDPAQNYEIRDYEYVALPEEWQRFHFDFLRASVDDILPHGEFIRYYKRRPPEYKYESSSTFAEYTAGSMLAYWESVMARHVSHTDDRPPEDWHDYITGRNPDKPPFSYMFKGFGGMMLRVIKDMGTRWRVSAIDVLKPPPNPWEVFHNEPWHWCWDTEVTTAKLPNKTYVVSPFPKAETQLSVHGHGITGTPTPLYSRGGYWDVDKIYTVPLTPGQKYSPYNPPR